MNQQVDLSTTAHFHGKITVEEVLAKIYYNIGPEYKEVVQEELNRLRAENNQLNAKVELLEAEREKAVQRSGASGR